MDGKDEKPVEQEKLAEALNDLFINVSAMVKSELQVSSLKNYLIVLGHVLASGSI